MASYETEGRYTRFEKILDQAHRSLPWCKTGSFRVIFLPIQEEFVAVCVCGEPRPKRAERNKVHVRAAPTACSSRLEKRHNPNIRFGLGLCRSATAPLGNTQ